MRGLVRVLALVASAAAAFAAAPAAALTLTFAVHVTSSSAGAPVIDPDFEVTWTFDPTFTELGGSQYYYGDVAGVVATPVSDDLFALGGIADPYASHSSYGGIRTMPVNQTSVDFYQEFIDGDATAMTGAQYKHQISGGDVVPAVNYTPGGFVYLLQSLGDLQWSQDLLTWSGGFPGGPPYEVTGAISYIGTARLVSADVDPEPPGTTPVPEPTTWALMIVGFGLTGTALRRRRLAATTG